ncbi:hypothetical protein ABZ078_18825 [Streptomyces sp. NPDC006385]|uniref:hypothetical protein n=1 Tax=Streptomyces sp. NPDC006385 TaxID=3156761 RepID=UPI00339EE240
MTHVTRLHSGARAAVAALLVVLLASCGSSEPETTPGKLFQEYTRSTDVKNDRFPTDSGSSEDRLATFAAYYTPEQLEATLLAATPCEAGAGADTYTGANDDVNTGCPPNASVSAAARDFAGSKGELFRRSVLVKREDTSLELITLYVARAKDRTAALIDSEGATYTGGLEDFRENNDLLGQDDVILTLRDITSVPGEGEIVAVYGHTAPTWPLWLGGGVGTVLVIGLGFTLAARRRTRTATDAPPE